MISELYRVITGPDSVPESDSFYRLLLSLMVQQLKSPSNGSTGDANNPKVGYVFYNFHSVTLPRSGIENLIQFVSLTSFACWLGWPTLAPV